MTYHIPDDTPSAASHGAAPAAIGETGAPEHEINVTPEMIEAGAEAIRLFEAGDAEVAAYSCFTAMVRSWPQFRYIKNR